jgi:hypothetical protein
MWRFLWRGATFGAFFVLIAELFFRTVVPSSQPPFQTYDPEFGILRLEGSPARNGQFTVGRLARDRTRWRLNQAGWNSPREYAALGERDRPCIAIIGNSYVEGFYADVDSGLTAALERELEMRSVAYNFGKSGVNAPQMLRVSGYVQHHFAPETFVFVLNYGSLRSAVRNFGFLVSNEQYEWTEDKITLIPPTEYRPNRLMRLHTYSAFVRYLYHNAGVLKTRAAIRQEAVQRNDPLTASKVADEIPMLTSAARDILRRTREAHPQARILFVMDGDRRRMYESHSRPDSLRESPIWQAACREFGCEFLDLTDAFWAAYARDGRPLDLASNYHWNQYGMAVVAREIAGILREPSPLSTGM